MRFRFLDIPVHIQPSFWILLIFFTGAYRNPSIYTLVIAGVFLLSLLVHEYGHALTAYYFGARPEITLHGTGGVAQYRAGGMTRRQEFLITLNGPLVESLLIVISYGLLRTGISQGHPLLHCFLYATMKINIAWCLLNLIPVLPLDGGRLLLNVLEGKWDEKGYKATVIFGLASVAVMAPCLYFIGYSYFAILLVFFGFQNFQGLREFRRPSGHENHFTSYQKAARAFEQGDLDAAKKWLKAALRSEDPLVRNSATELLAKIDCTEGQREGL